VTFLITTDFQEMSFTDVNLLALSKAGQESLLY